MTALRRLPDWPARFVAFVDEHESKPFAWGENDCCLFAAADVHAITGVDLVPRDIERWNSSDAAAQLLRRERGLLGLVTSRLGAPLPTPKLAQRGDVLLVRAPLPNGGHVRCLAVCDTDRWMGPHRTGLVRGPMNQVLKAWG
jgi:hypothetical protein